MSDAPPMDLIKYAESPTFDEVSVPKKLTNLHDTKAGVWGKIVVLSGMLDYIIPGDSDDVQKLSPGNPGWIKPQEPHRVSMIGPVEFKVEFYRSRPKKEHPSPVTR